MIYARIASFFLLVTGALHLYQHFLIIPLYIWLAMWVFGLIYLFLSYKTWNEKALKAAIIIPLLGAFMAFVSMLQGKMKFLPWTLIFIIIDFIIAYFAYKALKHSSKLIEKRTLVDVREPDMKTAFALLRKNSRLTISPTLKMRKNRLARLNAMTNNHSSEIVEAIERDYQGRSKQLTDLSEIVMVMSAAKHASRDVAKNMRTRRLRTALNYLPGSNKQIIQPKGVVGVMSPWNYPYQLAMMPVIDAVAAGNLVMIKPSESAPHTSALMQKLVASYFSSDEIVVITGELEVSKAFATLPFDHLLFTGSTQAGAMVAEAAARNLTPVTLELGGKSPAILLADANLEKAAKSIAFGRLFNAGQTCISPDYVLLHESQKAAFIAAYTAAVTQFFPQLQNNPDYTSIINERFTARLKGLLEEARNKGANVIEINPAGEILTGRRLAPHLILNPTDDMLIMQEEIFGPLLPIKTYATLQEAVVYVNGKDRPLSLYIYGKEQVDFVLENTVSGGVTVNDNIWHMVQEGQPFGGIGASGQGAYHGIHGFMTFSHVKPVFKQGFVNSAPLLYPPYGKNFTYLMNYLRKFG